MIIVLAYVKVKESAAQEFIKVASECVVATRQEVANISYTLYTEAADALKFAFVEEWESQAGLDAHMQTPHFAAFGSQIQDLLAKPLEIKVYEANKL